MQTEAPARLLLIDLENSIGAVNPRERLLRTRVGALLAAAGPVHHAVAGYAVAELADDPTASVLAELGVAPLRVAPTPDAAEVVLLAHARRIHDSLGCRTFLVASADRRFAELADLGRLELLAWQDQPIAAKLENAAHQVHRIVRPGVRPAHTPADTPHQQPRPPERLADPTRSPAATHLGGGNPVHPVITALATGVGIGVGQRLVDILLHRRRR